MVVVVRVGVVVVRVGVVVVVRVKVVGLGLRY